MKGFLFIGTATGASSLSIGDRCLGEETSSLKWDSILCFSGKHTNKKDCCTLPKVISCLDWALCILVFWCYCIYLTSSLMYRSKNNQILNLPQHSLYSPSQRDNQNVPVNQSHFVIANLQYFRIQWMHSACLTMHKAHIHFKITHSCST